MPTLTEPGAGATCLEVDVPALLTMPLAWRERLVANVLPAGAELLLDLKHNQALGRLQQSLMHKRALWDIS